MKQIALIFLLTLLFICCQEEAITIEPSIIGRWQLVEFDDVIRYDFTADKRFTIYSNGNNIFPTLEEFMEENPELSGNDWAYVGDTVVIDLNFGNYSRLVPNFKCGNKMIDWIGTDGQVHSTYYRAGHDISACN